MAGPLACPTNLTNLASQLNDLVEQSDINSAEF